MVDAKRLRRVLTRIADDVTVLRGYSALNRAAMDAPHLGHIKYVFVTALEGCINAAQHVCSSEGWGPPETNADAMRVLQRHHVLDQELAERLERAIGFRNRLVHGYAGIDDEIVLETLKRLDDLDEFVARLSDLI